MSDEEYAARANAISKLPSGTAAMSPPMASSAARRPAVRPDEVDDIIQKHRQRREGVKSSPEFWNESRTAYMKHLLSRKVSVEDIAKEIGVSPAAVREQMMTWEI